MDATNTAGKSVISSILQPPTNTMNSLRAADSQPAQTSNTTQEASNDFASIMSKFLGKTGQDQVNEEELFSSIIEKLLSDESPEAGTYYRDQVQQLSKTMARSDGYVFVEDVAKAALRETVAGGKIDEAKAELVHAKAFIAAQLDDTKEALYDGRGSPDDPTIAVASVDEAMSKMQLAIDEIQSGKVALSGRPLDVESNHGPWDLGESIVNTGEVSGAEGASETESDSKALKFAWKEVSDQDGKLAVLVPEPLSDNINSVDIFDEDGKVIESGNYSRRAGDGRAIYRFSEPGAEYGTDLKVVISKDNGDTITYDIPNGSERTTEWLTGDPNDRIDKKTAGAEPASAAPAGDSNIAQTT